MTSIKNKEQFFKDLEDWEREYAAMDADLTQREYDILGGDTLKSHEGMMYGRMYNDWKRRKGYDEETV
tara:strand:- start:1597 stop:1800 length:204 start_codon:yes stop_codon:yes gene_type:complete